MLFVEDDGDGSGNVFQSVNGTTTNSTEGLLGKYSVLESGYLSDDGRVVVA